MKFCLNIWYSEKVSYFIDKFQQFFKAANIAHVVKTINSVYWTCSVEATNVTCFKHYNVEAWT